MKFEKGKYYLSRDGDFIAIITKTEANKGLYCVEGVVLGRGYLLNWTRDGKFLLDSMKDDSDIVLEVSEETHPEYFI